MKHLKILLSVIFIFLLLFFLLKAIIVSKIENKIAVSFKKLPIKTEYSLKNIDLLPLKFKFNFITLKKHDKKVAFVRNCILKPDFFAFLAHKKVFSINCKSGSADSNILNFVKRKRAFSTKKEVKKQIDFLKFSIKNFDLTGKNKDSIFSINGEIKKSKVAFSLKVKREKKQGTLIANGDLKKRRGNFIFTNFSIKNISDLLGIKNNFLKGFVDGNISLNLKKEKVANADLMLKNIEINNKIISQTPFKISFLRINGKIKKYNKDFLIKNLTISPGGFSFLLNAVCKNNVLQFDLKTTKAKLNLIATLINENDNFNMKGKISLNLKIGGQCFPQKLSNINLSGKLFDLKTIIHKFDFLKKPFNYEFKDNNGNVFKRIIGEKNPSFAPIDSLPDFVIKALTTSEDASFFLHKGIDFESISTAFKDDLKKKILRGGSTITQQLVKNLFLNRHKNIIRKIKEALLAIELNNAISKKRQLEIYLNIAEFGPGIIGIGEASERFFEKTPQELTPLEAVYLISIIPAPEKFYFYFQKKEVGNNFMQRIYKTLAKMYERDFLTFEQFQKAMNSKIEFKNENL